MEAKAQRTHTHTHNEQSTLRLKCSEIDFSTMFCNLVVVAVVVTAIVLPFPPSYLTVRLPMIFIFQIGCTLWKLIVSDSLYQSSNYTFTTGKLKINPFSCQIYSRTFTYTISLYLSCVFVIHKCTVQSRELEKLNSLELNTVRALSPSHFFSM